MNIFLKSPIEESVDNIMLSSNSNTITNKLPSNYRLKSLLKVHTLLVLIYSSHNPCFEDNWINIIDVKF